MMLLVSSTGRISSFFQLIGVLVIFVLVLVATYFTTRFVAGYQKNQVTGKNMRVVETLRIAQNKYLQIVKVGEKYLVLSVGKDEVRLIAEIPPEEIKVMDRMVSVQQGGFQSSLSSAIEKLKDHFPKKRS